VQMMTLLAHFIVGYGAGL